MAAKPSIPKGTRDFSPVEMAKRNYIFNTIREVYHLYGFQQIETPSMEMLSTLMGKYGEEGDKLLFKIQNSGDYFSGLTDEELLSRNAPRLACKFCEKGLRYDLTVPFARYVVMHRDEITFPFKRYQIQPVWRADRPQRGRFRQFVQCDIDIFGDGSNVAEIELILAISTLLNRIGFGEKYNFSIVINDREILRGMQAYAGFPADDFEKVCISLDNADKIGNDGVKAELLSLGYEESVIDKYQALLATIGTGAQDIRTLGEKLKDVLPKSVTDNLATIVETVAAVKSVNVKVLFDPTLVRGMGYYTGPIFEIRAEGFSGSVGGGGRYDRMVGKFTGQDTPAVGFSIGFERIITIMLDADEKVPGEGTKVAFLLDKNLDRAKTAEAISEAMTRRLQGETVLVSRMNKNKKFQKEQLTSEGYTEFKEFYQDSLQ